jgi:hypothetical protein
MVVLKMSSTNFTNNVQLATNTGKQVRVGAGSGSLTFVSDTVLDVDSGSMAMTLPGLSTTARDAIASPVARMIIYNTTTNKINVYTGSAWEVVTSA